MRRMLVVAAATVVTLAALAVWATGSIRTEANTLRPAAITVQSDPMALMKAAGNLRSEQFDPF